MKKTLFVITMLICAAAFSQQKKFRINWDGEKTVHSGSYNIEVPALSPKENFKFSINHGVQFVSQWAISARINEQNVSVSNVSYTSIAKAQLKNIELSTIPKRIKVELKNATDRNKNYAMLSLSPIVKTNNGYQKVTAFTINYTQSQNRLAFNRKPPITNSILSSSSWYRFAINETGVFKLSKSFLGQLGINTNNIDPRTIKIYGNGGQMLPFLNSANYPLDPIENAIKVIGEEDGVLNDSDYILFYGVGPKGRVNDSTINTNINPYIDSAFYYITFASGLGERIQPFQEPAGAVTLSINKFQDYQFHEIDDFNLGLVGRRWFGDKFDIETSKTFDFNFPNLDITRLVNLKLVTATTSDNAVSMLVNVNGNQAANLVIPGAADSNNTASGIGHDIIAILDDDEVNPFVLNNYYVTELDDYTRGDLSFLFRGLEPGLHTLKLKAWDVYNNSSIAEIQFRVFDENESLVIDNVLNYPNPFVNYREFWFSHNSSEILNVSIQVFTISGKLVRTLSGQTTSVSTMPTSLTARDIVWDGRDDFGDKIGKGTYI